MGTEQATPLRRESKFLIPWIIFCLSLGSIVAAGILALMSVLDESDHPLSRELSQAEAYESKNRPANP